MPQIKEPTYNKFDEIEIKIQEIIFFLNLESNLNFLSIFKKLNFYDFLKANLFISTISTISTISAISAISTISTVSTISTISTISTSQAQPILPQLNLSLAQLSPSLFLYFIRLLFFINWPNKLIPVTWALLSDWFTINLLLKRRHCGLDLRNLCVHWRNSYHQRQE